MVTFLYKIITPTNKSKKSAKYQCLLVCAHSHNKFYPNFIEVILFSMIVFIYKIIRPPNKSQQ